MDVITYYMMGLKLIHVSEKGPQMNYVTDDLKINMHISMRFSI